MSVLGVSLSNHLPQVEKIISSPGSETPRRYHLHYRGRSEHLGDTCASSQPRQEGETSWAAVGSDLCLQVYQPQSASKTHAILFLSHKVR